MPRARNRPDEFAPITPPVPEIADEILGYDPTIHLLLGPQAVSILKKIDRHEPVKFVELSALHGAMWSAADRGAHMGERLTESQRDRLVQLIENADLLATYLILLKIPPAELDRILGQRSRRNPQTETTIILEPSDEDARVLALRVAGLYTPVFRWEPRISAKRQNGKVLLQVSGEKTLVHELVQTIYATLEVNNYRGIWEADRKRTVFGASGVRSPNAMKRRLLR